MKLNWRGWREYELAMKIKEHNKQLKQARYPLALDFKESKSKRMATVQIKGEYHENYNQ